MPVIEKPLKFRPERPIILSRENTSYKTDDELELAVEQLRDKHWLCKVCGPKEVIRPLHMSFDDVRQFTEFKRVAKDLGIKLKEPVIKSDEIEAAEPVDLPVHDSVPDAADTDTYEGTDGKKHKVK